MKDQDKVDYEAFINGDIEAFERLVIRYKDHLIYFIRRYINDIWIAEDVAQEVFVDVYLYKNRYNFSTSFQTYLFTIGRNKAIDDIRKNAKHRNHQDLEEVSLTADDLLLEDKIIGNENKQMIRQVIRQLKPETQALIHLTYFEHMSGRETAKILGITEAQVRMKLHRARKQLEKRLGKEAFFVS